jgi:hypothetical protein
LGATPKQVYIDGIPQLDSPFTVDKPSSVQHPPKTPNFDREIEETLKYDGLPPLDRVQAKHESAILYNISSLYIRDNKERKIRQMFSSSLTSSLGIAVVHEGKLVCGISEDCTTFVDMLDKEVPRINLQGGSIASVLGPFTLS